MEGEGGAGNQLIPSSRSCFHRPAPPLRPLKRFLLSSEGVKLPPAKKSALQKPGSLPPAAIGVVPNGVLLDETSLLSGLLVDGVGSFALVDEYCLTDLVIGNGKEVHTGEKVREGKRRGRSFCCDTNVVKGQWTAEEDSLLMKLVKQHGVRKWSHIAKKLVGRIGKQCRERWHNHLRPDIKKDTWTEEEESLLVEAHKKVGNKWAEISKLIPGRSENSIKNHWNATKRRQNSRKKTKKKANQDGHSQPSILQEYIRRKTPLGTSTHVNTEASSSATPSTNATPSCSSAPANQLLPAVLLSLHDLPFGNDSSTSTTTHMDEDALLVEDFFVNSHSQTLEDLVVTTCGGEERFGNGAELVHQALQRKEPSPACDYEEVLQFLGMDQCEFHGTTPNPYSGGGTPAVISCSSNSCGNSNSDVTATTGTCHNITTDMYTSYLLNGGSSTSPMDMNQSPGQMEPLVDVDNNSNASSYGWSTWSCTKRDMDLVEMISFSQFCHRDN